MDEIECYVIPSKLQFGLVWGALGFASGVFAGWILCIALS